MKKGINKFIYRSADESGVAIIIAIGFLAVILAVVISFANMSIVNKKLSDNYNSVQEARMTAQTAYNRALSVVDYVKNSEETLSMDKLYSKYEGNAIDPTPMISPNHYSDTIVELLSTTIDGKLYTPAYTSTITDSGPYWQYLPYDAGTDTPITSRFVYVVIANPGKIDPTAAIDTGSIGKASSEIETDTTSYNVFGRPGREVNEVFLRSLDDDANWLQNDYLKKMSSENVTPATSPDGLLASGEKWSSFVTLFKKLGISEDSDLADTFQTVFLLDAPPDLEAFWIDANGDEQCENSELYHRFNLTRNDWNSLNINDITNAPVIFNEAPGSKTNSIYWLNIKDSDNSDIKTFKKQIAANILDYCDSDTESTTDNTNAPTYNGNEKVPYINLYLKAGFKVTVWTLPAIYRPILLSWN
jgi:hypothetical protein